MADVDSSPAARARAGQSGSILKGVTLVVGLHVAFVVVAIGAAAFPLIAPAGVLLLGIGVTQLAYVFPLLAWASNRKESRTTTGIVIAAALTFLLNGACFAFFIGGGMRIGG